jgi:hypothetical protein
VAKSAYAQDLKSLGLIGKPKLEADPQESQSVTSPHVTGASDGTFYQSFSFSDACATLRPMPKRGAVVEQADTRDLKSLGPKDHSGSTPDSATSRQGTGSKSFVTNSKPRKTIATSSLPPGIRQRGPVYQVNVTVREAGRLEAQPRLRKPLS